MAATLRPATSAHAARIARILIGVRSRFMPYAPMAHSPAEVRSWVGEVLIPSGGSVVAELEGAIVGVMATERDESCSWITQMAVDPRHVGVGIGSVLLQHALRVCPLPIRLYTFQANAGACRFYETSCVNLPPVERAVARRDVGPGRKVCDQSRLAR
jgi:GNAT superfamily N-acetyltransferase